MSKKTKIWLIIAASLVALGLMIFAAVMTAFNWDFTGLSTVKYETNTHLISESFENISINTDTADILFACSDDENCRVVCFEGENFKHSVGVKDGTLSVDVIDERVWYDYIDINMGKPKITVYLPQEDYLALAVKESTGDVEIPQAFRFESISIVTSTGDVDLFASASKSVKIKTDTGDIRVENISTGMVDISVSTGKITASGVTCEGDVKLNVSTGKTYLTALKCKNLVSNGSTGDIYLKNVIASEKFSIERSTGDVTFDGCDAAEIFVETDTGDVEGSLLTEKIFITKTDTGKIELPKTTSGGRCEVITDTGDIKISVK